MDIRLTNTEITTKVINYLNDMGLKKEVLQDLLNLSSTSISNKLNNKTEWTSTDKITLVNLKMLQYQDIHILDDEMVKVLKIK